MMISVGTELFSGLKNVRNWQCEPLKKGCGFLWCSLRNRTCCGVVICQLYSNCLFTFFILLLLRFFSSVLTISLIVSVLSAGCQPTCQHRRQHSHSRCRASWHLRVVPRRSRLKLVVRSFLTHSSDVKFIFITCF